MFHFYSHINIKLVSYSGIKVIYVTLKLFPESKSTTENHTCLPFGTLSMLVMRYGSARPKTVPSSEAQVSPLLHAKAPAIIIINTLGLNGNTRSKFKRAIYLSIFSK